MGEAWVEKGVWGGIPTMVRRRLTPCSVRSTLRGDTVTAAGDGDRAEAERPQVSTGRGGGGGGGGGSAG